MGFINKVTDPQGNEADIHDSRIEDPSSLGGTQLYKHEFDASGPFDISMSPKAYFITTSNSFITSQNVDDLNKSLSCWLTLIIENSVFVMPVPIFKASYDEGLGFRGYATEDGSLPGSSISVTLSNEQITAL